MVSRRRLEFWVVGHSILGLLGERNELGEERSWLEHNLLGVPNIGSDNVPGPGRVLRNSGACLLRMLLLYPHLPGHRHPHQPILLY
jgi:hypothetical protein